jgi:predicted RNA-binding Zn ribbon-like protein
VRSELHWIFVRLAEGRTLRSSDLQALDDALNQAEVRLSLQLRGGRPHLETETCGSPAPVFLIARAAAEFLATADLSRVRQCEGTGCILLFYDTTRSHTRRWCSMAGCGNRSKVAAHYHRHRTG